MTLSRSPTPAIDEVERGLSLKLNVPDFYADPSFLAWLNSHERKFTWHRGGAPSEWSDVMVLVDPSLNGDGCGGGDPTFPEHLWDRIVAACRENFTPNAAPFHIVVWLTNLAPTPRTLTDEQSRVLNELRDAGYALALFSPDELGSVSPGVIEDLIVQRGNDALAELTPDDSKEAE